MSAITPARRSWLYGPSLDLLLGCGVAYWLVFALQGAMGGDTVAALVPAGILVMVAAIPHYGATLVRVYESAEDRHKYRLFAVWTSLALAALFVLGLRSALLGSLLLTVYLTWSPWHYTGQNYGIALMMLGRGGVSIAAGTKRWIYASFVLSFVLTFLAIHAVERSTNYAPVSAQGTVFHVMPLGIPDAVSAIVLPLVAIAYGVALLGAGALLWRSGALRALAPAAILMLTQSLWFAVPVVLRYSGLVNPDSVLGRLYSPYGFIWVAAAHSVQYLWITSYYAVGAQGREPRALLPYFGKVVLAGYAIWILPAALFAPNLLGDLPYESGLALMLAAMVNLHHFVLDGAIWKLRDGRVGRMLLRTASPGPSALPGTASGTRWVPGLVWGAGAVALGVALFSFVGERQYQTALQRGDVRLARGAAERLGWIGRDGPSLHRSIGEQLAQRGQTDAAREAFEKSLASHPTAETWAQLATLDEQSGDLEKAIDDYREALALSPEYVQALYRKGLLLLEKGEPESAIAALERAAELAPDQGLIRASLMRAERAAGRAADAN